MVGTLLLVRSVFIIILQSYWLVVIQVEDLNDVGQNVVQPTSFKSYWGLQINDEANLIDWWEEKAFTEKVARNLKTWV